MSGSLHSPYPFQRSSSPITISMDHDRETEHAHDAAAGYTTAPASQHDHGAPPVPTMPTPNPAPRRPSLSADKHDPYAPQGQGAMPYTSRGLGSGNPLPPLPRPPHEVGMGERGIGRSRTADTLGQRSGIDWIVPMDEKPIRQRTVGERLEPTLLTAISEKDKYALKARMTGFTLNAAIGIQVVLGALTTGLSAITTSAHQTAVSTVILGGLATIVASYLARARGSNEPELSITRVKDLEQFIRECQAFQMDHGHNFGTDFDDQLIALRARFEELLGNGNGERRLAPPV